MRVCGRECWRECGRERVELSVGEREESIGERAWEKESMVERGRESVGERERERECGRA